MDRKTLRPRIQAMYAAEHAALTEQDVQTLLDKGRTFPLADTLAAGGVAVFAHAGVADCGHQTAAAVHGALDACLDGRADRVVVISVLHAIDPLMDQARIRVARGGDPADEAQWGIQGPGLDGPQSWRQDHALTSWRFLWEAEVARRGLRPSQVPAVFERYPWLAGGRPDRLPGIDELARLCEGAVIVSTEDHYHHGVGYGDQDFVARPFEDGGESLARRNIEHGLQTLGRGDYWGWNQHCVVGKSDARDAGAVYRYLCGPLDGRILDLICTDAAALYDSPSPTWVAGALVEWKPADRL